MKEWTLYDNHPHRLVRLRLERGYSWLRRIGLGVAYERGSTGTTYREPGTNENNALHVFFGPVHIYILHTWKDYSKNRVDDPESYIYAQTQRVN